MTDMLVSGAGSSEANGLYLEKGLKNGKMYYSSNDCRMWWDDNQHWVISTGRDDYTWLYVAQSNVPTPDLAYWTVFDGVSPAPTVTVYEETEPVEYELVCASGSYGLSGSGINFIWSKNYTLACSAGTYNLSGATANLIVRIMPRLTCSAGKYTLSGSSTDIYTGISIPEVLRTYPIARLNLGENQVEFRDTDVIEASLVQEIHPLSIELPISTAVIRIRTVDSRFSPFSNGSFYQLLAANAAVDVWIDQDGEEHFMGQFYIQTWRNPVEGEFEFSCYDIIGYLDTIPYDGSFWEYPTLLSSILHTILDPLNVNWELDPALDAKLIKGYLPGGENISVRETLQSLLFAVGAYATTAKSNRLQIKQLTLPDGYTIIPNKITDREKVAEQKVTVLPMVTSVEVLAHDYTKGQIEEEIYSAILEPGYYKIIFSKPFWEIIPTGAGDIPTAMGLENGTGFFAMEDSVSWANCTLIAVGGEFEFGPNSIFLTVLETGEVSLRGKPWVDGVRSFKWENPEAVAGVAPNVWQVEKALMVSSDVAATVLDKLVNYVNLRYQSNALLFPNLTVKPGDLKLVDSLYGQKINGIVKKIRSDLVGGFLLETDFIGTEQKGT